MIRPSGKQYCCSGCLQPALDFYVRWWRREIFCKLVADGESCRMGGGHCCSASEQEVVTAPNWKMSIFLSHKSQGDIFTTRNKKLTLWPKCLNKLSFSQDVSLSHLITTLSRPPNDPSSSALPHCRPFIPHFFTLIWDSSPSWQLHCVMGLILVPLALHTSVWPPHPTPERR